MEKIQTPCFDLLKQIKKDSLKFLYLPEKEGEDHWQTTAETERLRSGDCEDIAFWCFRQCDKAGLLKSNLWMVLTITTDTNDPIGHMLCVYKNNAFIQIFDCRYEELLTDSDPRIYSQIPVVMFNYKEVVILQRAKESDKWLVEIGRVPVVGHFNKWDSLLFRETFLTS